MTKIGMALAILLASVPAAAGTRIDAALEAGRIDRSTAALYRVYEAVGDPALPAQYRTAHEHPRCGTVHLQWALDQAQGQPLALVAAKTAQARPSQQESYLMPSGRIRIHYDLEGRHAVDPTDGDGNGLPDYIDEVVATLDSTWRLQVELMGYQPPPADAGAGGGDEYDVYVLDKSPQGYYGLTVPAGGFGLTAASHLEIDNNFTDPVYRQTKGLDALHVTVAHEFFHALQFGYYAGRDGLWWQEACSTWMEDVAYPEVDDYLQYIPDFLRQPGRSLNNAGFSIENYLYGTTLFAHFLDRRYGRELIRLIWDEIGNARSPDLENFDRILRPVQAGGLAGAIPEYAVWNFFTGARARSGAFYPEAGKYATFSPTVLRPIDGGVALREGAIDHLGSAYFLLEPQRRPGGVTIQTDLGRGAWARQLILVGRDSVEVRTIDNSTVQIPGWDAYFEIALVLTSRELRGSGYQYEIAVEYDPGLQGTGVQPLALSLEQNFPNPFRLGRHLETLIRFELPEAETDLRLSIFAADGGLVRRFDLGAQPARSFVQAWDGNNEEGTQVASGLYYYVLEAGDQRLQRTLAVVR